MSYVLCNYRPAGHIPRLIVDERTRAHRDFAAPASESRHGVPFVVRSGDAESQDEESGVDREEHREREDQEDELSQHRLVVSLI